MTEVNIKRKKTPMTVLFNIPSSEVPIIPEDQTIQTSFDEVQTSRAKQTSCGEDQTSQTKETSCCGHQSKLLNSQRSNNRLKKRVMELKKTVKELQRVSIDNECCDYSYLEYLTIHTVLF